jgi:hypothetical protein
MLRLRSQWTCALVLVTWAVIGSPASAQERLDSSIRAWAEIDIYRGDLLFPGTKVTSVTPVLRGEVELSSFQFGLDLPLALGVTSFDSELLQDTPLNGGGTGARFGNPTLHADFLLEQKPLRFAAGLAFAISTGDNAGDRSTAGAVAADASATAGALGRGFWNAWWYLTDEWALVAPASLEYDGEEYELGVDAALAWFIPRESSRDNQGIFQLGAHAAAVLAPAVIGLRLTNVVMLDDRFLDDDQLQLSVEPYVELRLPVVWLGLGINVPLDEPLGIFGDGLDYWALRLSGGASF